MENTTSFLSCEKDTELIVKKLFFESGENSDLLKRLLVITAKDCLDTKNSDYKKLIDSISLADLWSEGYISIVPKIKNCFVTILAGYYHSRIEYPDLKKALEDNRELKEKGHADNKSAGQETQDGAEQAFPDNADAAEPVHLGEGNEIKE